MKERSGKEAEGKKKEEGAGEPNYPLMGTTSPVPSGDGV